jgi:hypothetical protein
VGIQQCSGSLVVMTSALHAEGREFNPRPEYTFVLSSRNVVPPDVHLNCCFPEPPLVCYTSWFSFDPILVRGGRTRVEEDL